MAPPTVQVEGLSRLVRSLQDMGVEVDDIKDAFSEIAKEGASLAAGYAPKRSGALAASVRGNRAKSKAVVMAGKARVPYAGAINYGWQKRNISASHFMQKASDAIEPRVVPMLEQAVFRMIAERGLN